MSFTSTDFSGTLVRQNQPDLTALAPGQFDAFALIQQLLASYGLTSPRLSQWVYDMLVAGHPEANIMLELEQQPEYKAAFPEIEARRARGLAEGIQLEPINPAMILEYRTKARALMRSFGVPADMWDRNEDFASFIVGDVSMDELNSRLKRGSERVYQAPPEVRAVFFDLFGIDGDTALFALMLDPTKAEPVLENMVQMAEAGGAARRMGFGLTQAEMTRMEAANLTYEQVVSGFRELDIRRGLFDETLSEEGQDFTVGDQGITAQFGLGGGAAEALTRRGEARKASTSGSSRAAQTEIGVVGLGEAGRR
jgi:hypothetical protein